MEVVKGAAQEEAEVDRFVMNANRVRNAFVKYADDPAMRGMTLSFGAAALSEAGEQPTALGLLAESERKRRGLQAKVPPVAAVKSVQEAA